MEYIRILKGGKSQVIKDLAFCEMLKFIMPNKDEPIDKLIQSFDTKIRSMDETITDNAMNNVHGDWYEWLLAITAWNYSVQNKDSNLAILTPNISQFDIAKLYNDNLYGLIQDLREKVLISSSVQLISSNPDFVIINRNLGKDIIKKIGIIKDVNKDNIMLIDNLYKDFIGKCNFDDIIGYIGVKSSLRPDRRLQISHEGSLMKALHTHLQTREWILNPKGLKYYAMSTKIGPKDRAGLKTVATHSITTVHSIPQAAVDEVFEVNSLRQAEIAFSEILLL